MTKFIQKAKGLFKSARDKLLEPKNKKFIMKNIKRGIDVVIDALPMSQKTKNLFRKYKKEIDENGFQSLKKIGQNISLGQIKQAVSLVNDDQLSKQERLKRLKNLSTKVLQDAIVDGQIIKPQAINAIIENKPKQQQMVRKPGSIKKKITINNEENEIKNIPLTE